MKKNIFLFIGFITFFLVQAQIDSTNIIDNGIESNKKEKQLQNYIYFSPLYLIVEGTRLDYEYRFANGIHGLNLGATFFVGDLSGSLFNSMGDEEYVGVKTDVLHKIYLADKLPIHGELVAQGYFSHGPFYQHSNIKYSSKEWQEIENNGLLTLNEVDVTKDINIQRFGYSAILGVQIVTDARLTFDLYTGLSIRTAWVDNDERSYDELWISPGHTGNVLLLGFKLGAAF